VNGPVKPTVCGTGQRMVVLSGWEGNRSVWLKVTSADWQVHDCCLQADHLQTTISSCPKAWT